MNKKYELTEESITWGGRTLYRIRAVRDFGDVKAGTLGGYIEMERNLSHKGLAWVYDEAKVYDNAQVYENAWVCANAKVYGYAHVCGNAELLGTARVCDRACVRGNAEVVGDAVVCDAAEVGGDVTVHVGWRLTGTTYVGWPASYSRCGGCCGDFQIFSEEVE